MKDMKRAALVIGCNASDLRDRIDFDQSEGN